MYVAAHSGANPGTDAHGVAYIHAGTNTYANGNTIAGYCHIDALGA